MLSFFSFFSLVSWRMNWVCDQYSDMVCRTAVRVKLQAWLAYNVVKVLLFFGAWFGTCVEAVLFVVEYCM